MMDCLTLNFSYSLIGLKLLIGYAQTCNLKKDIRVYHFSGRINLRAYAAARCATMSNRVVEDQLNDRNRSRIGLNEEEKVCGEGFFIGHV
jgi:hypothetical protein